MPGPLPESIPIHFGINGQPDNYGSPWFAFSLTAAISVLFISISIFLDELWARQETAKSFNWLSIFDDVVVGLMAGVNIGYINSTAGGSSVFTFPTGTVLLAVGGITGGGAGA